MKKKKRNQQIEVPQSALRPPRPTLEEQTIGVPWKRISKQPIGDSKIWRETSLLSLGPVGTVVLVQTIADGEIISESTTFAPIKVGLKSEAQPGREIETPPEKVEQASLNVKLEEPPAPAPAPPIPEEVAAPEPAPTQESQPTPEPVRQGATAAEVPPATLLVGDCVALKSKPSVKLVVDEIRGEKFKVRWTEEGRERHAKYLRQKLVRWTEAG